MSIQVLLPQPFNYHQPGIHCAYMEVSWLPRAFSQYAAQGPDPDSPEEASGSILWRSQLYHRIQQVILQVVFFFSFLESRCLKQHLSSYSFQKTKIPNITTSSLSLWDTSPLTSVEFPQLQEIGILAPFLSYAHCPGTMSSYLNTSLTLPLSHFSHCQVKSPSNNLSC